MTFVENPYWIVHNCLFLDCIICFVPESNEAISRSSQWPTTGVRKAVVYVIQYVLFNDTLNTFYLRLYGVRHMVKDHSDSEIGNPLPPHGLLFSINSKGSFICTIPQTG